MDSLLFPIRSGVVFVYCTVYILEFVVIVEPPQSARSVVDTRQPLVGNRVRSAWKVVSGQD